MKSQEASTWRSKTPLICHSRAALSQLLDLVTVAVFFLLFTFAMFIGMSLSTVHMLHVVLAFVLYSCFDLVSLLPCSPSTTKVCY